MLGGRWCGKTFVTGNSGLEGKELYHAYVWLSLRMKGEFTTESLSDTDAAPKGEARKARRPDLDLSPGEGCLYFKVIFQLNTTGEVRLTEMEITYR